VSDADLIARTLDREDRAAFGELVRNHQSAVRQFLRHLTRGDAALADDLAQETFVTAWRTLARFHGGSAFATWLLGIAHNHWRNARRRERPHTPLDATDTPELSAPATTPSSDLTHDLTAALAQLPADERIALHLAYQQGLAHPEIAALLDCPPGTVKTNIARGKARLRELLAAWNPQT
jgi:RNA polymerase sigma factor (sigma-70 family)